MATLGVVIVAGYVVVRSFAVAPESDPSDRITDEATTTPRPVASLSADGSATPLANKTPTASVVEIESPSARGCAIEDKGRGPYGDWIPLPVGKLLKPEPPPADNYVLLVHFHGAEAARRLLGPAATGVVMAAIDAGEGSKRYQQAFHGADALPNLLSSVDAELQPARRARLVVSAWSAGYGAVRTILEHNAELVDAVLLLDALHASYTEKGNIDTAGLKPFLRFASRAQQGDAMFTLTHSEITPPNYASTREVANLVIEEMGGQRRYAGLRPLAGTTLKTEFRERGLVVRGLSGNDRSAHCAQLRLLPSALRALL